MSIRCINADQNTLTIFANGWDASNVGYVLNVLHEGEPVTPYPGGFSRVLYEMRQRLPHCEMASYISLAYAYPKGHKQALCTPRRGLPAEAFEPEELNADWTIKLDRAFTRAKLICSMRSELCWRQDTEALESVWFDDYPTPFDPIRLDLYVTFLAQLSHALTWKGISTRVNASNLFYASQTEGELLALAKCCDGTCLEGEQLNDERKDVARFNYRLGVLAKHQSAITLMAPPSMADTKKHYDTWCESLVTDLQPVLETGKVFIGYPPQWPAPAWA